MAERPPPRSLLFVVESGTDVRLVEGLAGRFALTVLARRIVGGREISQTPTRDVTVIVGPAGRFGFARAAFAALRRRRPAAILVQGYGPAALAANLAARRARARCVMLVCSPVEAYYRCRQSNPRPGMPFRRHELAALSAFARANARLGQHYVVLSEHLAQVVRNHGTRRPVSVIPVYGVDAGVFRPPNQARADGKRALGLPTDRPLLLFNSRMAPEKDADTVIEAVRVLLARGVPVHLLHRSGGWRDFAAAAERAGIASHVTATDAVHPVTDLVHDYWAADLFVQASRAEGLGFAPLEALACETPVVAAAVGGLQETIVPGDTGWTYAPGHAEDLATAIETALGDPAEARRRAARGRALVGRRFARDAAFDRLAELLA